MSKLQYKQKDLVLGKVNFRNFSSRKREYTLDSLLGAVVNFLPQLSEKVENFNIDMLKLQAQFNLDNLNPIAPIGLSLTEIDTKILPMTESRDSFISFRDSLVSLDLQFKNLQEELKKYEDDSKLSDAYKLNKNFKISSIRGGSKYRTELYEIINDKARYVRSLTKEEVVYCHFTLKADVLNLAKLGILNLADIADMAKSKSPFNKLLKNPLYQCTHADLNYAGETELKIPKVDVYFLAAEIPDLSPSFRWVKKVREKVEFVADIAEATPMNREAYIGFCYPGITTTLFKYNAEFGSVSKTELGARVESLLEKQQLTASLSASGESRIHKI